MPLTLAGSATSDVEVVVQTRQDETQGFTDRIQTQQMLVTLVRHALAAMDDSERRELKIRAGLLDSEAVAITFADTGEADPSSDDGDGTQFWSDADGGTRVGSTLTVVMAAGSSDG